MWLVQAWNLKPNVGVISSNAADLWSSPTSGEGVVLTPGNYTRPLLFGKFINFKAFALKIQVGRQCCDDLTRKPWTTSGHC